MAEVKRLNYFNSQFLKEKDFQDEQAYHIQMRRLQNQRLHSWGIVYGLDISQVGNTEVSVTAGMAIDKDGREILLPLDPPPGNFNLSSFTGNAVVYLTLAYAEAFDTIDRNPGGSGDQFVRTTERPKPSVKADAPPTDGSVIVLAKVTLSNGALTANSIDRSARSPISTSSIAPNSITLDKLAPNLQPIVSVDGVSNPGGNIDLIATNAITINPSDPNNQITIGESHSARTDNPHGTTAAQIGALPLGGGTVTGSIAVTGRLSSTNDVTVGPFALPLNAGRVSITGASGELSFTRRSLAAWPTIPVAGDRFVIYNLDGSARLFTDGAGGDLLTVTSNGSVGLGTTTPGAKLQVSGGQTILEQEPWQTPALQNGWAPYGNGFNPPTYFKDSLGIVHLRGMVRGGTLRNTIFTLPAGYRPINRGLFLVASAMPSAGATNGSGFGRVDVANDGQVTAWEGTNEWLSLDGITFRAEALDRVFIPRGPVFINPIGPVFNQIDRINTPGGPIG